jgi:HSP20 family molecular chaperone IbpA
VFRKRGHEGFLMSEYSNRWMWSEAVEMLARAERLHRQLFEPVSHGTAPVWEPPADLIENDKEVVAILALPGVDPKDIIAVIKGDVLTVAGQRGVPPQLRSATIHRLELPQGRFERHLRLPPGQYGDVQRGYVNGCFVVTLAKMQKQGGARG